MTHPNVGELIGEALYRRLAEFFPEKGRLSAAFL
jgi:hypothetical protein